jgi:acyl carrier protein
LHLMTHTKEEIFQRVSDLLVKQFEVEANAITPSARLREDLDIDSIDAVNLIIELKPYTGQKLAIESFQNVRTLADVVDAVYEVVAKQNTNNS